MDWMKEAVESYRDLLDLGMEIYNNKEKAQTYADENTIIGRKVKEIVLNEWS